VTDTATLTEVNKPAEKTVDRSNETMSRKYFGTDGIRGRVGRDPITPDFVLRLGHAVGRVFAASGDVTSSGRPAVLIGKDTRVSGLRLSGGVVISASHNAFDDNGIKFFSSDGNKLPDTVELEIEKRLDQSPTAGCVASEGLGRAKRMEDARRVVSHRTARIARTGRRCHRNWLRTQRL